MIEYKALHIAKAKAEYMENKFCENIGTDLV